MNEKNSIINNDNNEIREDGKPTFSIVTLKNGEDFKTELQKNIEQYKYEFEKRLYSVLNKDIFNTSFDPKKNIFDTNGNFVSNSEKKNNQNQKSKKKTQFNINNLLKNNSFIYSTSTLNLDYGNQSLGSNKWKFKSENNIAELRKKKNNNQNQYLSKSYNNISSARPDASLYDLSGKKISRNKKDSMIRKTFEDLQKELNNLENDFKNNDNELNENKIIDLRKKELHKNYKEYIKSKPNNDSPNLRRYKKYVNDYEWAKKRHLDAINKQNIQKTTSEIDEITERLYNPDNYPNVYKMKFSATKSTEKLDSNLNKKKSSSKKKLNNLNNKEKVYSQSEPNLSSNDDYARARMIDQINNFSPLSPENFTMKSSKTKKISKSLNTLNNNLNIFNTDDINNNSNLKNINKNNMNIKNNDNDNNENIKNSNNNISKNKISNSQKNISSKVNKVGFSTEEIYQKPSKNSENIKNSLKNLSYSTKSLNSDIELNKSSNNLYNNKNESKSNTSLKSISTPSLNKQEKIKKKEKINKSMDSITKSIKKNKKYSKDYTEEITEIDSDDNFEDEDSFDMEEEDTGEQAALQFQHIMSISSKSINNLNNYE